MQIPTWMKSPPETKAKDCRNSMEPEGRLSSLGHRHAVVKGELDYLEQVMGCKKDSKISKDMFGDLPWIEELDNYAYCKEMFDLAVTHALLSRELKGIEADMQGEMTTMQQKWLGKSY